MAPHLAPDGHQAESPGEIDGQKSGRLTAFGWTVYYGIPDNNFNRAKLFLGRPSTAE